MSAANKSDTEKSTSGQISSSEGLSSDQQLQSARNQTDSTSERHDQGSSWREDSPGQNQKLRPKLSRHEKQYISNQITTPNAPFKSMKSQKKDAIAVSPNKGETKVNDPYKLIEPKGKRNAGMRRIDQVAQNMDAQCPECNRRRGINSPTKDLEKKEIRPL